MKIMLFNTFYSPFEVGGAEKSVRLLAEHLVEEGIETSIVTTAEQDEIEFINGVKVIRVRHSNLYWALHANGKNLMEKMIWHATDMVNPVLKSKIAEIIQTERPDVIHTNNLSGLSVAPWILAKQHGLPVVHTLRDYSLMCKKGTMFKNGDNCSKRCGSCAVFTEYVKTKTNQGLVKKVIGNSDFILRKHKELGFFRDVPAIRIFNGAEIKRQEPQLRKHGEKLRFLYVGRIEKTKGVNELIALFTGMDNAELWLAGKVYDTQINERISRGAYPSHIRFLGFVTPSEAYSNADMLIAPSLWHEPLPRVVLEAYSYGLPVIGSNRGGIPECIEDGISGFLYDPANPEELKARVQYVLNRPSVLTEMSARLPEYLRKFDIRISVKNYIHTYRSVIRSS